MLELTKAIKEKIEQGKHVYIPGSGDPTSKLWIVGEAGGEDEEKAKQPFVGSSGNFLNSCLGVVGINRRNAYITNVCPARPPANNWGRLSALGLSEQECADSIKEQIAAFRPNCVIALGGKALAALTGKTSIIAWRGYIQKCAESKVVATFHPAYTLRLGDKSAKKEREGKGGVKYTYSTARATFLLDLKRAREESESRVLDIAPRDLRTKMEDAESLFSLLLSSKEVAFDIETQGPAITCIAYANANFSLSLPFLSKFQPFFERINREHCGLVAQNGLFDMGKLKKAGAPVFRLYSDTLVAHHLLYPELPHNLDYMASIYCRLTEPPHVDGWDAPRRLLVSNALHASVTFEIWKKLEAELKELDTAC